jgi:predicted PurR-regulated permease PerM
LTTTVVALVVLACLYWAQTVFIPVAMAVFLAFLLSPLVAGLQRRGLGRVPSVLLVVALAALVLAGVGWMVTHEVVGLVEGLPQYTDRVRGKIKGLRELTQGSGPLGEMIQKLAEEWAAKPAALTTGPREGALPAPPALPGPPTAVTVPPETPAWLARLPAALGSLLESLAMLALALVLVMFMLLKREDLRNRLLRLAGHGQLTATTKAFDEAGKRISRFLLMQVILNGSFGLALSIGLLLIGVDYAFLWGFLAAVLRYIPYLGIWVAAVLPITLSVAMFDGWLQPFLVIGLFLALDLVTSNVFEPWLFGRSMGVSEVALLVSAAFWAFLWGPIGMVLSCPLTVCLVVLGRYVPHLEFLDVLLGDEPALSLDVSYYQRMLARDQDEATALVLARVKATSAEQLYDEVLVPALNYAKRDRERENLTEADEQFILRGTREIVEDLGERQLAAAEKAADKVAEAAGPQAVPPLHPKVRILGCPGHAEVDRLALDMLGQLLDPARYSIEVLSTEMLSAELVALAAEKEPAVVCIGALPPGGLAHTRFLCKRLRAQLPRAKIVVGRWGLKGDVEQNQQQLQDAGADQVETTLAETRLHLDSWLPVLMFEEAKAAG